MVELEFEAEGYWWPSGSEDLQTVGKLVFNQSDGPALFLTGSFEGATQDEDYEIVLGICDRRLVSLVNVRTIGWGMNMPGFARQTLRPSYALVGEHLTTAEDLLFEQLELSLDDLGEWFGEWGAHTAEQVGEDGHLNRFEFVYQRPGEVAISLDGARLTIKPGAHITFGPSAVTARPDPVIIIEPETPMTVPDLVNRFVGPLQDFFSLACSRPNAIQRLRAYNEATAVEIDGRSYMEGVDVLHRPRVPASSGTRGMVIPNVRADHFLSQPEEMMRLWFKLHERLDPVVDLFFSTEYVGDQLQENVFLNLAQSMEGIHRRWLPGLADPPRVHTARLKAILESCPDEFRKWLKGNLKFSNELHLADRLRALFKAINHPKLIKELFGNSNKFVDRVVEVRNYFAHWNPESKATKPNRQDLFVLSRALTVTGQLFLLRELGCSDEQLSEAMQHNRRARDTRDRAGVW